MPNLSRTFTRTKDFPTAETLCNANLDFCHECQAFKCSEPELDSVDETVLGNMDIKLLQTQGCN